MSGGLPIESAPRDGEERIGAEKHGEKWFKYTFWWSSSLGIWVSHMAPSFVAPSVWQEMPEDPA